MPVLAVEFLPECSDQNSNANRKTSSYQRMEESVNNEKHGICKPQNL